MKHTASRRTLELAALLSAGAMLLAAALGFRMQDVVLYNHSPSLPQGFYFRTDKEIASGAIVTIRARDVAPALARERSFTGERDRFLKRVAAIEGDFVCVEGERLTINGQEAARRRARDSLGRPLPAWSGCRALGDDEALLLGDSEDSFDGRYWGPVTVDLIEGVWRRLF